MGPNETAWTGDKIYSEGLNYDTIIIGCANDKASTVAKRVNQLTEKGKKMVHYLEFKNDTISLFLNKINIESTIENISQISKLDYKIIVALRNLI